MPKIFNDFENFFGKNTEVNVISAWLLTKNF